MHKHFSGSDSTQTHWDEHTQLWWINTHTHNFRGSDSTQKHIWTNTHNFGGSTHTHTTLVDQHRKTPLDRHTNTFGSIQKRIWINTNTFGSIRKHIWINTIWINTNTHLDQHLNTFGSTFASPLTHLPSKATLSLSPSRVQQTRHTLSIGRSKNK